MVKKKTARQKVREKVTKQDTTTKGDEDPMVQDSASQWGDGEEGGPQSAERTSMKRKMAKQLRFLSKLQETQRVLSAKKSISKKKRKSVSGKTLPDLSSLAEFLPSIGPPTAAPATKILRSKAKQKIVVNETKQLAAVLAHPQFKSNPFAAIQQHLTNTLPGPSPAPPCKPAPKGGNKKKPGSQKK